MPTPPRVVHLAEFEPFREGAVPWIPLRRELGISAFGINAYAGEPGEQVIEEHDENSGAAAKHEEVYLVHTGRVSFTIDGEPVDAPAGSVVFVPDPASRRGAVAEEPDTLVVAIGGVAGEAYAPAPWETSLHAVHLARRSHTERARAAVAEALAAHGDHPHALYNVACAEALLGDRDAAVEHLRRAIELEPKSREWAADDTDLDAIRDDPRFPG